MLENLFDLVKEHAGDAIINNPDIPNERNDEAIHETTNTITNYLQQSLAGGNVNDLLHMFSNSNNVASSPVASGIQNSLVQNLMGKFGIGNNQASGIAATLIPIVLQQLVHRTNDQGNSSFNIQGIFNQLSGGKTGGLDIGGLLNQFTGGGGQQQQQQQSGGILDTLKGLFGG